MSDSTPRPWALHSNTALGRVVRGDFAGRGGGVAQFVHAADAEFCVRACNAHEAMRAALEELVRIGDRKTPEWDRARDALRLAGKP